MVNDSYDLAVLGCGPAGLSAAINAAIRNKKVIVVGTEICSPPLHKAQNISNYLGIAAVSGEELLDKFMQHAHVMDINITNSKAEGIFEDNGIFNIMVKDQVIKSKTIVIATGVPYRPTLPGEQKYLGRGLGYCATCDGPIYKGKDVLLIGHSPEAEYEADFMAEICRKVYYLPLYDLTGEINNNIQIVKSRPESIVGDESVKGLKLQDGSVILVEGIFILGAETSPDRLIPGLKIENNHIWVNRQQETNLPGVYAAGDCTGAPYQVAKSVGEGQVAGLNASKYASSIEIKIE